MKNGESLLHLFVDGTDRLRPPYCTYCGTSDPDEMGKKCNKHFAREQGGGASPDWLSYLGPLQSGEFPHRWEPGYENHNDHVYGGRYRWNRSQKKWVAR
jgi:hypothetical protein